MKPRFLQGLTPQEFKPVAEAAQYQRFPANYVVINQDDRAKHLYLLLTGRARYFFLSETGKKVILLWIPPGEVFGPAALLVPPTGYHISAETITNSLVLVWDRATIRSLAARYPKLIDGVLPLCQQRGGREVVFRADAAFAKPEVNEALEERGVKYAIRIPANDSLERDIEELLTRPVGRPSHNPVVWYKGFLYQAASWKTARRVVAKVEFHAGELFPRVGFLVTNLETPSRAVVRFYNKRGTAEQWIKEGKQAVKMTRLSCYRFRANEVRLALSLLAYNLGNLWRRLVLPQRIANWSPSLQQRLVKTGGRLIKHARYYWLLLAESHLTRRLFGGMVRRMAALPLPTG